MSKSQDAHAENVFGALTLAVSERVRNATSDAAGHGAAGPAALVTIDEFLSGASVEDLRRAVGLTHSGAVRLVDRLVAEGYAARRPARDGRSVSIVLTAQGRRAARRVRTARAQALRDTLSVLTAGERVALTRITEKLLRAVTRDRLDARARGTPPPDGWLCRLCDPHACGREHGACPAAETAARS